LINAIGTLTTGAGLTFGVTPYAKTGTNPAAVAVTPGMYAAAVLQRVRMMLLVCCVSAILIDRQ
jgi:hypothetical protein